MGRFALQGAVLAMAVVMAGRAYGVSAATWDGANNNWTSAGDWLPQVVPQNGTPAGATYAVVVNGGTVNVTGINPTVTSISMGGNGVILESGTQTLTVTGAATVGSNSVMTFGTGATGVFGTVDNSGGFYMGYGFTGLNTVSTNGLFRNESGATLRVFNTGDEANFNSFMNLGTAIIGPGATLKITGGGSGITDVGAGSNLQVLGTVSVVNGVTTTNGLANLATVEGTVVLDNGTATAVGAVTVSTSGTIALGEDVAGGTTLSATSISNSGTFETGFGFPGGSTVNTSGTFTNGAGATFRVWSTGDVANLHAFTNLGTTVVNTNGTLKITGGGLGITDVGATSNLQVYGTLSVVNGAVTSNGLANLGTVEGVLVVDNGQATTIAGGVTVSSSGILSLGADTAGTTFSTGSVSNSGFFETGYGVGAGSVVNTSGTFTNAAGGNLRLWSSGDEVNVNAFSNFGTALINPGATLKITGGGLGITDVQAGSTLQILGTVSVVNGAVTTNALANLSTVEGGLVWDNGQALTTGAVTVSSTGIYSMGTYVAETTLSATSISNSGIFETGFGLAAGSVVNTSGTFTNAAGGILRLWSSGDAANLHGFVNLGTTIINPGATLKITGGGLGVTDVPLNSALHVLGTLSVVNGAVTSNGLTNLETVEGALEIGNGQTLTVGNVTEAYQGVFWVNNGTTLNAPNIANSGFFATGFGGNGGNKVNVSGTFTNNSNGTLTINGTGDVLTFGVLDNLGVVNINSASQTFASLTGAGGAINGNGNVLTLNGGSSTNMIRDGGLLGTLITNGTEQTGAVQLAKLVVNGHQTISSPGMGSKVSVLSLTGGSGAWTSGLNLTPITKLVVEDGTNHAATLAQVKNQVLYGKTHMLGIYSSGLLPGQVMAVSDNAVTDGSTPSLSSFGGVLTDTGSVLVTPTYLGDANMDGVVDISDLTAVANHWQGAATDWRQGDFDASGTVDILDLTAVANHWQSGEGSGGGSSFGEVLSEFPAFGGTGSVPEPGTVGMLGVVGVILMRRKRVR